MSTSNGVDAEPFDIESLKDELHSSSTKRRTFELERLQDALVSQGVDSHYFQSILNLIFETYPFFVDSRSRLAVERVLSSIATSPSAQKELVNLTQTLEKEALKHSIAPGNAFVLVRWSSRLLQDVAASQSAWQAYGKSLVKTLVASLNTLLAYDSKSSTRITAFRVSRRAFRALLTAPFGTAVLDDSIALLTAKSTSPTPENAVVIGIIAGVCRRSTSLTPAFETKRKEIVDFYVREFLGSRVVLPAYIADSLREFFAAFVPLESVKQDIVPTIEKALLRAPEVVLNDILAPLFLALPSTFDLSGILSANLLKPLLANVKSTNVVIRTGALRTFSAIAQRCNDEELVEKIATEILTPLRTNKIPSADQRALYVQFLAALRPVPSILQIIPETLVPLALKEANETAAVAEIQAIGTFSTAALNAGLDLNKVAIDGFAKGTAEKKPAIRRAWIICLADILWSVKDDTLSGEPSFKLVEVCLPKLIALYDEIAANSTSALQSGQIGAGYAAIAICCAKAPLLMKEPAGLIKAKISARCLSLEPKSSFLLLPRVYTKLTSEDDILWLGRALESVLSELEAPAGEPSSIGLAWAQAILYIICSSQTPPKARSHMFERLRTVYDETPEKTSGLIIDGLWKWCEDVESQNKDSAAVSSRVARTKLYTAVRCICPIVAEQGVRSDGDAQHKQMLDLLVLCQPALIPRAPWIEMCLQVGIDPGQLVSSDASKCMRQITVTTEHTVWRSIPAFQTAASTAAAEAAFVAPEVITPLVIEQINQDLDDTSLHNIGPTEAAIYRTLEGEAYVDVLSKSSAAPIVDKNTKDYDTLKWEAELRSQLAQKKGTTKKLTAEEQSRVKAQLAKESQIRSQVAKLETRLRRGISFIEALSTGPPSETDAWFGPAIKALFGVIQAGAGLIVGDAAALAYITCAQRTSKRLGVMQPFVGIATLRAAGLKLLPENYLAEPLGDLVTRVLYRLRFLSEQRPFEATTFSYMLPILFLTLAEHGIDRAEVEGKDEQVLLAIEIISFHTETCSDTALPRQALLQQLIQAMQTYTQHFREIKDCFTDLCRFIAPTATNDEIAAILDGTILSDQSVRNAVLQAVSAELQLEEHKFYAEIWLERHDDVEEHVSLATEIWEENDLTLSEDSVTILLPYIASKDSQLRRAAARSIAAAVSTFPSTFDEIFARLQETYSQSAKPIKPVLDKYGLPIKQDLTDPWETRHGVSLAFKELTDVFPVEKLVTLVEFLIQNGPLSDRNHAVRDGMVEAATTLLSQRGGDKVEGLMKICEATLEASDKSQDQDLVNEAVVVLYGALAKHLPNNDSRLPVVVNRLLTTLSTPSESVQYAVANCLPPLVRASKDKAGQYVSQEIQVALSSDGYAARRGAAYGVAGIVKGKGLSLLRDSRLLSTLKGATENKKSTNHRQGAFLTYELLSLLLGKIFEPYVIEIVPQLLTGFGDSSADVREACLDASKTCVASLSSFGVKQILPTLLEGLEDQQWRSKKGACDLLGAMAYLDPQQLAISLPIIIPPLTEVLNDSHKEVRTAANRSLQRFGEVITNPEVKSQVSILLKALSDPTKYTDDALDALIKVNFVHYLDAPSLALVVRILERGLGDRSATKRKASQIIGSLAHLTERKDLTAHLPILVAGLRVAIVDPVPTTRATASKALGSTVEKLGEDALPDLIPSLMQTLKSDTGAGDRLGSAQALSEVLAGLGTSRLEDTLPTILQNVASSKPSVREGFMSLFIYLPACFGNSFANYLAKVIPPILAGLADDIEAIRETALRAGRLLVKNFASRSIDLLLPELERGLGDDSYRIRLSSVELVGDLLFNLTGISGKTEEDEVEDNAHEAGQSLLEVLGEDKRNKILSSLYICRNDTSGLVRSAAINVWKALVSSPRTLREITPTLTQLLVRRLASSNMEQKVIAGNALGELIRKAGESVLATLLPTLEEGLQNSADSDARQGICIALRELISSASSETLEEHEKTLISIVRIALVDADDDVREAAAEAFDSLQKVMGKRAVDQVLPHLLSLLRSDEDAQNALSALLTLLAETTRSNIILPNLLPTLLRSPISAFNARALASLAQVAGSALSRRLTSMLNSLMDNIVTCKDEELKTELDRAFDIILLSVDEYDGLNSMMSIMLGLVKHDDHRRRASACLHLAKFFESSELDYSRYYPDLIRNLLNSFGDGDMDVVKAAWTALSALTQKLRKEEMESLVISTRQTLNHVGMVGHNLPGFSLPKGINAILPIFLQGLMNGSAEQRTQAALAISDVVDRTSADGLKPFVTQITGPLIRVVSERSTDLKAAILLTLNNLLDKIPIFLKPFLPQLQRTFAKALADPSSEVLRSRAARALGTLITMTPRVDPLIAELVTGSKTTDAGVRNAMLKALYEVVSKAGANMSEASRNSIMSLIDADVDAQDDATTITFAKLLGALIKVLPQDLAAPIIRSRVLSSHFTSASVLALNAVLVDAPQVLTQGAFAESTPALIVQGIQHRLPNIADNCVLAAGKWLLSPTSDTSFETSKPLFEALANVVPPGGAVDTRRLALVVIRTVSREHQNIVRPHLAVLVPPIFASVRDPIIPIKLSAEAAFLSIFDVVEEDTEVFDKYMAGPGAALPAGPKRSIQEYFKRIALRLSSQVKERREAEGGAGGLGLSNDERDDEREVWSVGRVDLGEGSFSVA